MAETQSKYVTELKTFLWKRDSIIAQLQLTEQQLQSALARYDQLAEVLRLVETLRNVHFHAVTEFIGLHKSVDDLFIATFLKISVVGRALPKVTRFNTVISPSSVFDVLQRKGRP